MTVTAQTTSEHEPQAIAHAIFQLQWNIYLATLSDSDFLAAKSSKPPEASHLAEKIYDAISAAAIPKRHIIDALQHERRFLEAMHFAQLWTNEDPDSIEAHRALALLACRCVDLRKLEAAFERLRLLAVGNHVLRMLQVVHSLVFADGADVCLLAHAMLDEPSMDPLAVPLAIAASVRSRDVDLLIRAMSEDQTALDDLNAREQAMVTNLLRVRALGLLVARERQLHVPRH